ncbi:MAG: metallophosphoesterase [Abditibacteriota bacterium]|nr:metallophosphoesterase [Abditibacteriota bacterium]
MKKLLLIPALIILAVPALWAEKTVAELNPDFVELMVQALRPKNEGAVFGYRNEVQPLSLFWFTDIHGDAEEFGRLIDFYNGYEKYFDGMICTGDLVCDSAEGSDFTYWSKTPGHEKVMSVIGNHDVLRNHNDDANKNRKDALSMAESYARYFAPFIDKWGAVYESGKTYYYRDYDAKNVRLIVLDTMLWSRREPKAAASQLAWFKKTLAGAKEKDLSVLVAAHFTLNKTEKIPCNFTVTTYLGDYEDGDCDAILKAVDDFMKSGGKFVCYIAGHTHNDFILRSKTYPKQLEIVSDAACDWQSDAYSESARVPGTRSRDLANAFVVDTSRHLVKLIRIGANRDSFMRSKNGITLDYVTQEIISQY